MQGSDFIAASYIIPCIQALLNQMNSSQVQLWLVKRLKEAIQVPIRLPAQEDVSNSSVMNPQFKRAWCNTNEKETPTTEIHELAANVSNIKDATPPHMLFGFMNQTLSLQIGDSTTKEIEEYQFCHPTLDKATPNYFHIPATSAAVKCLFSIRGRVFRPDRCSLSDKLFETLMLLKCNMNTFPIKC